MEIFGFDFMIDAEYNVWLIEVNTNPCLEESSVLLKMLIPRMLNDAFSISIDQLFPGSNKKHSFHCEKYSDDENMWERLGNI